MMPDSSDPAAPDFFEMVVTQFTPKRATSVWRINTLDQLDGHLATVLSVPTLAIGVACVAEGCDWGTFTLLLTDRRAWVHLMEARCVTARVPSSGARDASRIRFLDDAGHPHEIPLADTVPREQGIQALRHWSPSGAKLPLLTWLGD
jgi:hypothetical protein